MSTFDAFHDRGTMRIRRWPEVATGHTLPVLTGRSILAMIERYLDRRRSRLALLAMTDEQLKDIGCSRADAYYEGNRPFWQ